jgi:hypothetical protein
MLTGHIQWQLQARINTMKIPVDWLLEGEP